MPWHLRYMVHAGRYGAQKWRCSRRVKDSLRWGASPLFERNAIQGATFHLLPFKVIEIERFSFKDEVQRYVNKDFQIKTPKSTLGDISMSDHRARVCRVNYNNPLRGTVACSPMRAFTLSHVEEKHKIV